MGDSDITLSAAYIAVARGSGPCLRVNYKASGPKGWAGIYWQNPANNWGDVAGRAGYDLRGATRLTFWARGEKGGERIHEIRVGGIVGQYPDSDVATMKNIRLTKEWKSYTIDLSGKDLRHIIGGFGFFVNKAEDSGGVQFYLDDIIYEGPEGAAMPMPASVPAVGQAPVPPVPAVAVPAAVAAPKSLSLPVVTPSTASKDLTITQVVEGLKVSFSSQLLFASGQATLAPASGRVLKQVVALLAAYPTNRVMVEGHTDSTGDPSYNVKLSELRARAVRDSLIKEGGYAGARFQVTGYGSTRPIADNKTAAGRSLNRRVEVTILKSVKP